MTSGNGADVPAAVRALREAGWTVRDLAADLDLHRSTIYRWAAGTRRPNAANFTALAELVDARYGQTIHGRVLAPAVHLKAAAEALRTDADRSRREATAERLKADQAERQRRDDEAAAQRRAELEQLRAAVGITQRQPRRSAYAEVDPFVLAGAGSEPALPF